MKRLCHVVRVKQTMMTILTKLTIEQSEFPSEKIQKEIRGARP